MNILLKFVCLWYEALPIAIILNLLQNTFKKIRIPVCVCLTNLHDQVTPASGIIVFMLIHLTVFSLISKWRFKVISKLTQVQVQKKLNLWGKGINNEAFKEEGTEKF